MAVSEQTPYIEYVANGNTTTFALGYECVDAAFLVVKKDGVVALTGSWALVDNSVVFTEPPSINTKLTFERNTSIERPDDFQLYDNSLRPASLNSNLDYAIYILQEIASRLLREIEERKLSDAELTQYVKDYVESILSINNPEAITLVLADIVQTSIDGNIQTQQEYNEYILEYINTKYPSVVEFIEEIQTTVDAFVAQAQSDVSTAIAGIQPTVDAAVANAGNMIGAANKAALDLITDKPVNQNAMLDNGDIYRWNGTIWVSTGLNYLNALLEERRTIESNRPQNPNKFTFDQVNFTTAPTATVGTVTYPFRNGIKQIKLVSAATAGPIIVYWDFNPSVFTREFAASIVVEGLTSGSNGLVGVQQIASNGTPLGSTVYAQSDITSAVAKKTYKVNVPAIDPSAVKIRLIVNMQTTTTREMYVHSPFIADGTNAEFIAPVRDPETSGLTLSVNKLNASFDTVAVSNKNKFNPALAADGQLVSYSTGANVAVPDAIAFGKQAVVAGTTYTFWIPTSSTFSFFPVIYTYSSSGTFLGLDHSIPSSGETINANPPTGIVYSDSNKTVTFTIPSGSTIAFIQLRCNSTPHGSSEFTTLVNSMQLETGSVKTSFEPYNPSGDSTKLVLKDSALPSGAITGGSVRNTFTVTTDGTDAYIRTGFSASLDLVQKVRYGSNAPWSNNVINPWEVKTIPKTTAKDGTIAAFPSGLRLVLQGDDAAPLNYNGTYIGANHGAYIVHEVTVNAHGKTYADVGSRWNHGADVYTIVRIVDANKLWLVSQNVGSTYWQFITTSLSGITLTHNTGAGNTASFTPSADLQTQLYSAINNHTKKIVADGFKELTAAGVYDVECVEFIDNYDIMNPVSILSYLQSRVGTVTEQNLSVDSIASDVRVSVNYRYALNGSCTVSTQLHKKANINLSFAGLVQANPLNYSGKTLIEYANKMKPVTVGGTSYDLSATIDATNNTAIIGMLKADWLDATNPPDRMMNLVKNGSNKEFGQVLGYSLTRGATKPSVRQNTTDAGFFNNPTTKKVYPKALVSNLDTVVNAVAYRSLYNPNLLPQATVYTWYEDNGEIFVILDIHQSASMLKLPLPTMFNGKSASVVDANANFTLHSEIVSDGGLLCSVINGYGQATIKLS